MKSTNARDAKIIELRRRLEEAEAEARAEERAEQKEIEKAKKLAGDAHTRAVLGLYELLGIEPEVPNVRRVRGEEREVAVDRDEKLRSSRLLAFVEGLVDGADEGLLERLRDEDESGRQERRPKPKGRAAGTATDLPVGEASEPEADGGEEGQDGDERRSWSA
ncbi:hypothetical protein [Brachybacterium sp. NPDC056505]|jgi:hypothetical protein|uniref:hypothetical protein n=1 Tax=Brachybacterium sp. NPDC056505 TaxID=3345843 RepID=UPI00366D2963